MSDSKSVTRRASSDVEQGCYAVCNPDGSDISGAGAGVSDVNIVSIDGTVPSLTIDNLNVQLSHADATPDSVRIGDGTTLIGNDFGVTTASLRTAAHIGNATGIADFNAGAAGAQTIRSVSSTTARTPAKTTAAVTGTVSAGAQSVTLITSSDFSGSILTDTTLANTVITFAANGNDTVGAIAYVVTTGSIQILTLT